MTCSPPPEPRPSATSTRRPSPSPARSSSRTRPWPPTSRPRRRDRPAAAGVLPLRGPRRRRRLVPRAPAGPVHGALMFTIATEDVRGVPTQVWADAPATLLDVWELAAGHGDAPFLVYEDEVTTYARAHDRVDAIAAGLVARFQIQPGDRVAIAARNYPEWALAFWAAIRMGAVAVPLNAWWTGPELAYAVGHSGSRVVLGDAERLERLAPHVDELPDLAGLVGLRTDAAGAVPLAEIEARGGELPRPAIGTDDDATILYTSGTTGRPKGAVGTHRNAVSFLWNGLHIARRGSRGRRRRPGGRAGAVDPADVPALPRGRAAVAPAPLHAGRRQARAPVPLGSRPRRHPHRARRLHRLLRRADHRLRAAGAGARAGRRPVVARRDLVRRHPRAPGAGPPHRRPVRPPGVARQRLRPHRDLRCDGLQRGP